VGLNFKFMLVPNKTVGYQRIFLDFYKLILVINMFSS